MAPNITQVAATSPVDFVTDYPDMRTTSTSASGGDEGSCQKEELICSTSPVCVSSFLSFAPPFSSKDEDVSHRDGTFEVQRSSRKGRIKRGSLASSRNEMQRFNIAYRIYRPEFLTSRDAAPLIVLHGGPSLPSGYLYPISDEITSRSIIFYDQLGCGRSDQPEDFNMYSISSSVDDLEELIKALSLRRFHLYGHSFGGIIAYEYIKRVAERPAYETCTNTSGVTPECLSVILSNTSTSVKLSDCESDRILDELKSEIGSEDASALEDEFWKRHQCRMENTPKVLRDAMTNHGVEWFHTKAVTDYAATCPSRWARQLPPAKIISGGHDFVASSCTEGWTKLFNHEDVTIEMMKDCAHYPHLESPRSYAAIVEKQCERTT